MVNYSGLIVSSALALTCGSICASGQQISAATNAASLIQNLHSPFWNDRRRAFNSLIEPIEDSPPLMRSLNHGKTISREIRNAIIDLLDRESIYLGGLTSKSVDQAYYLINLTDATVGLHDPNALDVLIKPAVILDGDNLISPLAAYGRPALNKLLAAYKSSSNPDYRLFVLAIFGKMIKTKSVNFTGSELSELGSIFMAASQSADYGERLAAVDGLALFGEPEFRERLSEIAKADTFEMPGKDGTPFYPLRAHAEMLMSRNR